MGIKATVVYDIPRHITLVLRTLTVSISERYEVIDAIASFSSHCESLRGVAHSVTEVSAEWGGPPYVTYNVVHQRFRVIVIWDEGPAEFDLSHDVEHCLTRLENAVVAVQVALVERSTEAIAKVYDEAGHALRGDVPIVLPNPGQKAKKASNRPKLLSTKPPSGSKRSSHAEPRKKKSSVNSSGLFGKIGSALRNATSGGSSEPTGAITHSRRPNSSPQDSNSSLRPPSEGAAMSVAMYGSETGFDDELGELDLPEDVFAWASFGEEPSVRSGDLKWFEELIHGEPDTKRRSRKPLLRHNSAPSTPLTIPSSAPPLSQGTASIASSVVESGQGLKIPPVPSSTKSVTVPMGSPGQLNPSAVSGPPSIPGTPVQPSAGGIPTVPQHPGAAHVKPMRTGPGVAMPGIKVQQNQTLGTPNILVSQNPVPAGLTSGYQWPSEDTVAALPAPHVAQQDPGMRSPMTLPHLAPSFTLPSATGPLSPIPPSAVQSDISRNSLPSTPGAQSMMKPTTSTSIPPALAVQLRDTNEFDISHLGEVKDEATVSTHSQSANLSMKAHVPGTKERQGGMDNDEALRSRMNEFAMTMQAGNFTLALQQVYATLKILRQIQPRRERETITCSNYVLAQKILIRNAVLETELTRFPNGTPESVRRHIEMALLTMFLAELKHLLPRHRVAAMKVAIEKNIVVGNFGMCARWLRHLVEKAPLAQKAEFSRRLEMCVKRGESNAQMPPTNRLCYITLQVLTSPYGKCSVCSAVYHPQMAGVVTSQVCPICLVGAVEERT